MKRTLSSALLMMAAAVSSGQAQHVDVAGGGDYLAGPYSRDSSHSQNPPVIGLRRKADFIVVPVSFSSDSRDAQIRKREIQKMLAAALERVNGAGLELVTGFPKLSPVTKANYESLPLQWAGREDTGKVDVFVKAPLSDKMAEAEKRIDEFLKPLPRNGRGTIVKKDGRQLAVRNPEQYRGAIVALIAEDARRNTEVFGPDYRASVDGVDKPVLWAQTNETDVFLYLPYSYRIFAK